jgi:hypothetical protein
MPLPHMSRRELASLDMMVQIHCLVTDIPHEHVEKFLDCGFARRDVMTLRITELGQIELLRQHFRGVKPDRRAARRAREAATSLSARPQRGKIRLRWPI